MSERRNQLWAGEKKKSGENSPSDEELLPVKNVDCLMTASVCLTRTWESKIKTAMGVSAQGFFTCFKTA